MKIPIKITVNGDLYSLEVPPAMSLLDLLRDGLGLTGTKSGCNKGECGACTVILNGKSVNSCLILAVECDKAEVLTIEGIADKGKLHPVQQAFIDEGAIQCGFCTPGMIMRTIAFLKENPNPTPQEARASIEGNICRCTGYEKIVKAILKSAEMIKNQNSTEK